MIGCATAAGSSMRRAAAPSCAPMSTGRARHTTVCFFTRARRAANPQPAQRQGCSKEQQQQQLHALLLKAESITFSPDEAAADLVDAERMLLRAIQAQPQQLQPRVLLLRNLMRQAGGRERDVPALALQALQAASAGAGAESDILNTHKLHMLQATLLALKALHKLQAQPGEGDCSAMSQPQQQPVLSVRAFLADAQAVAPAYASDFNNLATRVRRQLACCGEEVRQRLLADAHGYMSCVDLFAVFGAHHAAAERSN